MDQAKINKKTKGISKTPDENTGKIKKVNKASTKEGSKKAQTDDERENTEEIKGKTIPIKKGLVKNDSKPSRAAEIIKNIVLLLLITLFYVILMTLVGGSVYANYGWRGRGSNGTFVNSFVGMVQVAVEKLKQTETSPNQTITTTRKPTTPCPTRLIGTCPLINSCIERTDTCISQSPPPCIALTTTQCPPCQREACLLCPPRCQTTVPPIETFRSAQLDTKTAVEWLNMYPPYSANRLEVVTTLLDQMIEDWVVAGFFHRCTENNDYPRDETKCFFCQDRYDYIKCIMSNNLVGQLNPNPPEGNVFFSRSPAELKQLRHKLADVVYDRITLARELDPVFEAIEKVIKPFSVRTQNGGECRVCKDFQRTYFNPCINHHKQWYVSPSK